MELSENKVSKTDWSQFQANLLSEMFRSLLLTSNPLYLPLNLWLSKLLLLQAEQQFATCQIKEADATYQKAIESARDHRFVNEEAISCELAGIFYNAIGKKEKSSHPRRPSKAIVPGGHM